MQILSALIDTEEKYKRHKIARDIKNMPIKLENKIQKGTVILFDEYFNYPGWQRGEFKAFQEFIKRTKKSYKYLTYNNNGEQVAIKLDA